MMQNDYEQLHICVKMFRLFFVSVVTQCIGITRTIPGVLICLQIIKLFFLCIFRPFYILFLATRSPTFFFFFPSLVSMILCVCVCVCE